MQSITTTDGTTLTAPDNVKLAWAWAERERRQVGTAQLRTAVPPGLRRAGRAGPGSRPDPTMSTP